MLDEEHITIGVATTLANYSTEIQEIVFAEHYQEGVPSYYSWDRKRPTELQKAINSAYSTNLDRYSFDKKSVRHVSLIQPILHFLMMNFVGIV